MEQLEKYFDTAFGAPDGIKKLRELILTLAMQGKLVEQDLTDKPATELLKVIEKEKLNSIKKQGNFKNQENIEIPINQNDIPDNWTWVRFGNIAQHNSGKTLDGSRNKGIARDYITTSNLYWGRFALTNVRKMLIQDEELERCTARQNDLLLCEGGEAGRAAVWENDYDVCFQNHIHRARFYGGINPYYAQKFFEKLNFTGEIKQYRKGVGISNLSSKSLASIPFPLPPIKEQSRIVSRINQLMYRCDELEKLRAERDQKRLDLHTAAIRKLLDATDQATFDDAWQFITRHFGELYTVKENVAELRKAILQLAVMGKLVKLESSVSYKPLKELTTKIGSGSTPFGGKNAYHKSGTPLIRSMNVHFGGFVYDGLAFIDDAQAKKLNNVTVQSHDVLLNITGASIGRVSLAPKEMNGARVNQHVSIIRTKDNLLPEFLEIFLSSPLIQNWIQDIQVGATREALTKAKIEQIKIPVPSVEDQRKILEKVKTILRLCKETELKIDQMRAKQGAVMGAVMGELS